MIKNSSKHFNFSHVTETSKEYFLERLFGILPGFLSWTILISLTVLSFFNPIRAAIIIVALNIFWLMRISYMTLFLAIAYMVLAVEKNTNWIERCQLLEKGRRGLPILREKIKVVKKQRQFKKYIDLKNEERELKWAIAKRLSIPHIDSIYHVVIIAAAKEGREVVEPGILGMIQSQFPAKRIVPIIAVEERTGASQAAMARGLQKKYRENFYDFLVTVHPDGLPGEAQVKGANVTFAAKRAAEFFKEEKIPFENIIVSCFDADTIPSPNYFAALTYHFMRNPSRTRASFQPIPVYHNNILEAPAFVRILETGSSFFQLIEATNPEKLVTFSSHSMSFQALVEIGYWPVDMISDDSAIFWKALIHYGGDYRVVPMYVTLSMDAVLGQNLGKTIQQVYKQKMRWAWGVENFPIVMRAFCADKRISLYQKLRYTIKLLEMHITWATLGFLITFIGWLPAIFATQEFSSSVFYYNSSKIAELIFNLASFTFIVTIIIAQMLLPKHQNRQIPWFHRILYALEWLLIPLVFTFLSCLPALDAQTRLARGRMMKFFVTEKRRAKEA